MSRLTTKQIDNFKARNTPYKISDDNGLYIWIAVSGTKSWQYRYQVFPNGKKTDRVFTIGKYPELTLKQARAEHLILRTEVNHGIDVHKRKLSQRISTPTIKQSFKDVATEWNESRKSRVGKTTWDKDWSRVERFVFPMFANKNLEDMQGNDLIKQLTKVAQTNGRETAMRTMNHVSSILKYAMALGKIKHNVASGLTEYLPKPQVVNRKAILDPLLLGQYIYTVENNEWHRDLIGCAIRLIPHIFVRHSEMLSMKWKDIDWDKQTWIYEVGKTRNIGVRKHKVFLTEQVIKILEDCKKLSGDKENVFHGDSRNSEISQRATMYRIRELGFDRDTVHVHGFRASARTLGVDELKYESRVIELCLAHKTKEILGESYDRSDRFDDRRNFMNDWSDFLIDCKKKYQKSSIKIIN